MTKSQILGFTLVELLVVMAILSVLVAVTLTAFRSSQAKGRDAQRKSDLKQMASSLELFYSDYGKYPSDAGGVIDGCPYSPSGGSGTACGWGSGQFTDGKTVYFKVVPKDPASGANYFYRVVDSGTSQKFQLFAYLENTQDPSLITTSYLCGAKNCNFAITSPNTTPTE